MAGLIPNRGLQVIGGRASNTADSFAAIQSGSVDDSVTAFTATDTNLGSPTNQADANFDSTPTRSGQLVSHVFTLASGVGNFLQRRFSLHNAAAASVSGSSNTLVAGVDSLSITKNADFTETITMTILYSDNS